MPKKYWEKPVRVKKIAIVSPSLGLLGEPFVKHEKEIGFRRLRSYGIEVVAAANACKGIEFLKRHPEARAQDLLDAFRDPSVDMILCAIGGDDTYRLLPHLFGHDELLHAARNSQKIFLGFSDATVNHFMLHKAGIHTFYGQSFLSDVCELEDEMLPYSRKYFEELLATGTIQEIRPSDVWYGERTAFDESQIGVKRVRHPNRGFELLQGNAVFSGKILGGCIETIYDMFDNTRHDDSPALCRQYDIFPSVDDWRGKILLLESGEECAKPEIYQKMLQTLKAAGIFAVANGVLAGKPMNEVHYEEYKRLLISEINKPDLPIVYNLNVGHATPRCIVPLNVEATVDAARQVIRFAWGRE